MPSQTSYKRPRTTGSYRSAVGVSKWKGQKGARGTKIPKTPLYRTVKKVVNSLAETKQSSYSISNYGLTSVLASDFDATIRNLTPSGTSGGLLTAISQGTGQGSRIGNKIAVEKATLSGVVHVATTYDATANFNACPLKIGMYIIRMRPGINDDQYTVSQAVQNSFFQNGSSQSGFSGRLYDLTREPNNDVLDVLYKRVFTVGQAYILSSSGNNVSNTVNNQYSDNSVGISQMFQIDVTKYLPSTFTFNDSNNTANNRGIWIFWVPLRVDGTLIQTSVGAYTGTRPAYVDWSYTLKYKDM